MDAPWRHPGADASAFFNYGHTMRSWREYCRRVEQYRLQFTLQKKVGGHAGTPSSLKISMGGAAYAAMHAAQLCMAQPGAVKVTLSHIT